METLNEKYIREAKERNIDLTINEPLEEEKQDPLWHGSYMASFVYRGFLVTMGALGEVRATLKTAAGEEIFCVDKNNAGLFASEMKRFIKNDQDIYEKEAEYSKTDGETGLFLGNNNWYEVWIYQEETRVHLSDNMEPMWDFDDLFDIEFYKKMIDNYYEPESEIQAALEVSDGIFYTKEEQK